MSIDNQLLFCYLEEDNIQQAYFRVRPLLTPDADIRQEAMNQFPVEGCLRIVPDRNEQHTFKSRMRDLGHYCLVDLANLPAEATKSAQTRISALTRGSRTSLSSIPTPCMNCPHTAFMR